MKIKFFGGKWDSWGFGIDYCHYIKGVTVNFIHWYFGFEVWTKDDFEQARKGEELWKMILEQEDKPKKKPVKKAAKKK